MTEDTPSRLGNVVTIDDERIKSHLDRVVRGSVEETLNALLDAEADRLCNAERYERSEARRDRRAGHYERKLQTKAGEVKLRIPKLRAQTFETAIIERYRRRESSVEEALIEMYLAGVSVRRVEDITEALWGTRVSPSTVSELNKAASNYADAIGCGVMHSVEDKANGYWLYEAGVRDGNLIRDDLPSLPAEIGADRRATFCWIYPNLLLALLSDHVVSWIMQPTDQRSCLLHMDVFARESASEMTPESKQRILACWLEYTRGSAVAAETSQTTMSCAAPKADTDLNTILNELPVERNYLAYCAQKYLIDRLLARHTYYWNDAYTNPRLAASPSTRGAS
jgi:hypothetical protein